MKKILALLLCAFALSATAKETVTIMYGFSPADTMANYSRTLAEEANRIQDKYTFVFDTKPGAGNSIAANYVLKTPNTIFATSGAFFVRPNFYPNESYDVQAFQEILPQCNAPMSIASVKYKSWKEVPANAPITVATSGLGVVSHLTALQILKKYPNGKVIPFKSTTDALVSTVAGQTDFAVGFLGDHEKWTDPDGKVRVTILGTSGPKPVNGHPSLVSAGFDKILASTDNPHQLMIPVTTPKAQADEWRKILFKAANSKSVRDAYAVDHCGILDRMEDKDIQPWFQAQNAMWSKLTVGVKLDNK